ncbi:hypothetical protein LV478_01550 (plasmid) [Komagataeibacter oboediens]|uniref:hypothetical protein n=1 Tax=Komagataeibacter oboediens TaxID=65958 RepID=UPI0023DA6801|nr:hypothetical protein [Komagataeibacter oboediens]WEQ50919.1 hypothetical protein LV478_01550 [Komagataeibacter oboediens]
MTDGIAPAARPRMGRWLVVAIVFLGFLGQLFIQSQTLPDETPRLTIQRLTGIDIAAPVEARSCRTADSPATPVAMAHMLHVHHAQACHTSSHHHDASCPLCPLLHIPVMLHGDLPFLPFVAMAWISMRRRPQQPRAPPVYAIRLLPPLRGPPDIA